MSDNYSTHWLTKMIFCLFELHIVTGHTTET